MTENVLLEKAVGETDVCFDPVSSGDGVTFVTIDVVTLGIDEAVRVRRPESTLADPDSEGIVLDHMAECDFDLSVVRVVLLGCKCVEEGDRLRVDDSNRVVAVNERVTLADASFDGLKDWLAVGDAHVTEADEETIDLLVDAFRVDVKLFEDSDVRDTLLLICLERDTVRDNRPVLDGVKVLDADWVWHTSSSTPTGRGTWYSDSRRQQ